MKKHFSSDTSTINGQLAASHLKSADACLSGAGQLTHLGKALACQPAEGCSPELAKSMVEWSTHFMNFLLEGEKLGGNTSILSEIIETYGKSIPYAPAAAREQMKSNIASVCRNLANEKYNLVLSDLQFPQDFATVQFIGLAYRFAPEAEKQALLDEFIAAYPIAMKFNNKDTVNYSGKGAKLWQFMIEFPAFRYDNVVASCFDILKQMDVPADRLESLRYDVAQVFADKAAAGTGKYYAMLERTHDALSWLPGKGEKAKPVFETLSLAYLNAGKAAAPKQVIEAALLFRIARTFNCSDETRKEIDAELAHIKPQLDALKANTHNVFDGGPTLVGEFAGSLASNEGKKFNTLGNLGDLLLKYMADTTYLYHIEYSDARGLARQQ